MRGRTIEVSVKALNALVVSSLSCLSGLAVAAEPVKVSPVGSKMLAAENGRFVFGQISDYREDRFMLDTKTGRLYQLVVSRQRDAGGKVIAGSEVEYLSLVPYRSEKGNLVSAPEQDQSDKK